MGLRTAIVVGLAAFAGWLLVRGLLRRRVPWIGLGALLVPLLVLGVTERQWIASEHAFSAVARGLAPASEGVHCQRLGETFTYAGAELGHVEWDEDGVPTGPAMVSYETCGRLAAYRDAADRRSPDLATVVAVHVLTHEAMHLAGRLGESDAECAALQRDAWTAERLGATPEQARALAERYWREVYHCMPGEYVSRDCREDGPGDESPNDGSWP